MRPVTSFLPHEETIPSHVERIAAEIRHDGVQKDPIIVDAESGAVLDGMHRLAAFSKLGMENAVCYPVDYSSRSVGVHRWARVYSSQERGSLARAIAEVGVTRRSSLGEAFDALDSRNCGLAAFSGGEVYLPATAIDLAGALSVVRKLDGLSQALAWRREFVPEDEVDAPLQDANRLVVLVRRLRKDDVVAAARTRRLFPCKTSMHTVDPRPVAVNFPTKDLAVARGGDLRRHLAFPSTRLLPPNSVYQGRRYKERLLLLHSP